MTDHDALIARLREIADEGRQWKLPRVEVPQEWVEEAATALREMQARIAELDALATRSTRRLVELSEPGSIGAFAARDMAMERATKAEAERDALLKAARELRCRVSSMCERLDLLTDDEAAAIHAFDAALKDKK